MPASAVGRQERKTTVQIASVDPVKKAISFKAISF
jgi:hypothetical protein